MDQNTYSVELSGPVVVQCHDIPPFAEYWLVYGPNNGPMRNSYISNERAVH